MRRAHPLYCWENVDYRTDKQIFSYLEFVIASFLGPGRLATERGLHSRPHDTGMRPMKNERRPTTYLTVEELTKIAARKLSRLGRSLPPMKKKSFCAPPKTFAPSRK